MKKLLIICLASISCLSFGQSDKNIPEKYKGMKDVGPAYVDIHFMGQIWARYTELNPGSL